MSQVSQAEMLLRAEIARLNQALEASIDLVNWYIARERERNQRDEPRLVDQVRG